MFMAGVASLAAQVIIQEYQSVIFGGADGVIKRWVLNFTSQLSGRLRCLNQAL